LDLVPPLEPLGGKLRPEWVRQFMAGEIPYKPRAATHPRGETWLEARMPAFHSRAKWLAEGLAAQHGMPPLTPPEPPVDAELAKIGRKLAGKEGGLSCVSCHGIGASAATEVFESEGINLTYSSERLLPSYYRRWLRNPLSIDPQTKMPVYFEEGKSQLADILDGDSEKQIDALWNYIRLGDKMQAPGNGSGN
jgi:mono/diheme cytochrome c family protein